MTTAKKVRAPKKTEEHNDRVRSEPQLRAATVQGKPRAPRVRVGKGDRLRAPTVPDHALYWAIDRPGELEAMEAAWWEYVLDENGVRITRPAGSDKGGRPLTHYLMKLPSKLRDEDREEDRRLREERMKATLQIDRGGPAPDYIPQGHTQVQELEHDINYDFSEHHNRPRKR